MPNQAAELNPFQQLALLGIESTKPLTFDSMDDYLKWKSHRGR